MCAGNVHDACSRVELQSDQKIVAIAGAALGGQLEEQVALRFDLTGTNEYQSSSQLINTISPGDRPIDAAVQPDDKLLAGTRAVCSGVQCFGVTRFLVNGNRDGAFGTAGTARIPWGSDPSIIQAMRVQGSSIYTCGTITTGSSTEAGVAKIDLTATLDASFGTNGQARFPSLPICNDLLPLADDRVLLLSRGPATNQVFQVARLTPGGALDSTFGINGVNFAAVGGGTPTAMALQAGGSRIIVAGQSATTGIELARFCSDGFPDPSFGTSGLATYNPYSSSQLRVNQMLVQPDNKILVVGTDRTTGQAFVVRFLSDGRLDDGINDPSADTFPLCPGSSPLTVPVQPTE